MAYNEGRKLSWKNKNSISYKLTGSNIKHILPPNSSLHASQDTHASKITIWPAHSGLGTIETALIGTSHDPHFVSLKRSTIPKPRFLLALETYVNRELAHTEFSDSEPNELRLQTYREAFEYFIENFTTYKPLLSEIKNEYEKMLSHRRLQIRELESLKSLLVTVSEQCDQKILDMKVEDMTELTSLRKEKMELQKRNGDLRENEISLQSQVERLQQELAKLYKKYRSECDMRKLLVSDLNEMKLKQESMRRIVDNRPVSIENDALHLKLALKVAKEDLTRQSQELTRIQAEYGDVIPRREVYILETKNKELEEKNAQLTTDFQTLKEEHSTLLEVYDQVVEQRNDYCEVVDILRESATPRPQWSQCGYLIPDTIRQQQSAVGLLLGVTAQTKNDKIIDSKRLERLRYTGIDYWDNLIAGKRSADILEALLNELKTHQEALLGLGENQQDPDSAEEKNAEEQLNEEEKEVKEEDRKPE